ncbi:uncharacterized protein SPAPADRAFT_48037 [Spathaspora passalidarum NRRL Y-27907]|uniref:Globin domain-containing protein n=1 Tax=Spathaspora passalidarum (strain NRRL Y-27907 / 11-Y1) TaxID=619300 RepID=G3AFJ1_SPAPN|nr:uncharacterized protein SPAPADRAFT_48037 [Spathaspora passalidarum NRRL Y-27907]EGW34980.1 hypothetical protein SPAPADRAFT_48037 [Spathaspora passalidarum NRRL Y-27907]
MTAEYPENIPINQIKVRLELSKSEIELIRYTLKMLVDDGTTTGPISRSASAKFPGRYPEEEELENEVTDVQSTMSTMAKMLEAKSIATVTNVFCDQVYQNLISGFPEIEKMFPSLRHQATHLATVLRIAVTQLEDLSRLDDYLCRLGKMHRRILNVEPPQYELMGKALIKTFQERFGTEFNYELENVWIKLYRYLADSILQFGIDPVMNCEVPVFYNRSYPQPTGLEVGLNSEIQIIPQNIIRPTPTIENSDQDISGSIYNSSHSLYRVPKVKSYRSQMVAMARAIVKQRYKKE